MPTSAPLTISPSASDPHLSSASKAPSSSSRALPSTPLAFRPSRSPSPSLATSVTATTGGSHGCSLLPNAGSSFPPNAVRPPAKSPRKQGTFAWLRPEDVSAARTGACEQDELSHFSAGYDKRNESHMVEDSAMRSFIMRLSHDKPEVPAKGLCQSLCQCCANREQVFLDHGWLRDELKMLRLLVAMCLLGCACSFVAWLIPYGWSEFIGIQAVLAGIGIFVVMAQRRVVLLEMTLLTVPYFFVVILVNYISLTEALDKDNDPLYTEEALEVAVETNAKDRVAARVVICLEALLLVVLLYVAETAFDLGGIHRGVKDEDLPLVVRVLGRLQQHRTASGTASEASQSQQIS